MNTASLRTLIRSRVVAEPSYARSFASSSRVYAAAKGKQAKGAKKEAESEALTIEHATSLLKAIEVASPSAAYEITITTKFTRGQAAPRGKISLPKDARAKAETVLVFASGKSVAAAKEAGAHYVGGEELIPDILESKIQPTKVICTPTLLPIVQQKLGKFLGPKGLMPAEKRGTVTMLVGPAVKQAQGTMNWKSDRFGVIRAPVARINWTAGEVMTNVKAFVTAVKEGTSSDGAEAAIGKKKPSSILQVFLSSRQGPGIRLLDAM
ncbi:mitochondrial 54S ribosomal protein mrpl1 [Tulasnella sp. 424]|nr:mitochondrial 54S ribosomal protein mrpl1 [Tulasnella sp. 424]KAG8976211.1 mitochondrial 54S ribosomal protein mrpl1 [Tulasnella sp. 425]